MVRVSSKLRTKLSFYQPLLNIIFSQPVLLSTLILASVLFTLSEGLGLGLILAFLDGGQFSFDFLSKINLLDSVNTILDNMSLVDRVRFAAIALVLIVLIRNSLIFATLYLSALLQIKAEQMLRQQIFQQFHEVQLSFIQRKRMGNLLEILNQHARQAGSLIKVITSAIVHIITVFIYTSFMLIISWPLTLLAIGLLAGLTAITRQSFHRHIKQTAKKRKKLGIQLKSISLENLAALRLIHLFGQEKWSISQFEETLQSFYNYTFRSSKLISLTQPLFRLFNVIALSVLLIASTFFLPAQTETWLGSLLLFLIVTFRLMGPVAQLSQTWSQVTNLIPALNSVMNLLDRKNKPYLKDGSVNFNQLADKVMLKNVTFHYNSKEQPVLRNVTFEIPKGKMTAIVGASGAGKSTLVNLITRLYDCNSGQICIDSVDIRDLEIASWRSKIAVVSQDTFLFNNTVLANLKFARADATDEEIFHATKLAQAHDFIVALPKGYETLLGDRGVRLSGGQKQRVAIARAILANPQLILLDEATSHLDVENEQAIQKALEQFGLGRTLVVIAHRLSTIRNADQIVVLDDGQVIEQGSHSELMHLQGSYWQLVQAQSLETGNQATQVAVLE